MWWGGVWDYRREGEKGGGRGGRGGGEGGGGREREGALGNFFFWKDGLLKMV